MANSKLLVVDNLISQTAQLRLKKITEIREKADDFVHELNRMREEDQVDQVAWLSLGSGEGNGVCRSICPNQDSTAESPSGHFSLSHSSVADWQQEEDDARKLLEQALQLQISDMMDAIKVSCRLLPHQFNV